MRFNTTFTFTELFKVEEYHCNITNVKNQGIQEETEIYQVIDGFQFKSDQCSSNYNHSVRTGIYYDLINENVKDALHVGLNQGESAEIYIPDIYLPYLGYLNWSLRIPNQFEGLF